MHEGHEHRMEALQATAVSHFEMEPIQTREFCVATTATRRADRPDPFAIQLRAGSSLRKSGLLRMTIKLRQSN
jgi:hypothetical protein